MREKAKANKATEHHQVAAWDKALADKANKQCCYKAAAQANAFAKEATEQRCHEAATREKALANRPQVMLPYDSHMGEWVG